jgi:hypothetical protein
VASTVRHIALCLCVRGEEEWQVNVSVFILF